MCVVSRLILWNKKNSSKVFVLQYFYWSSIRDVSRVDLYYNKKKFMYMN